MLLLSWELPLSILLPIAFSCLFLFAFVLRRFLIRKRSNSGKHTTKPTSIHRDFNRFDWSDHPSLVEAAIEGGWSSFVFSGQSLQEDAAAVGRKSTEGVEISWEIQPETKDYLQKIRIFKRKRIDRVVSVRAILPLPGPPLGPFSFPQEAYWEVTILGRPGDCRRESSALDGEKARLMSEVAIRLRSDGLKKAGKVMDDGDDSGVEGRGIFCVGLVPGGSPEFRFPGEFRGSVGFTSLGIVYLEGTVGEECQIDWSYNYNSPTSLKANIGSSNTVIGCGYDPSQKRVFFTVDSVLVRTVVCNSDACTRPLYPAFASNYEVSVLVNLGQSPFMYEPANFNRTADPCFVHRAASRCQSSLPVLVVTERSSRYDDSESSERFSIGRIDPQWAAMDGLNVSSERMNGGNAATSDGYESDLFEIVLDRYKS